MKRRFTLMLSGSSSARAECRPWLLALLCLMTSMLCGTAQTTRYVTSHIDGDADALRGVIDSADSGDIVKFAIDGIHELTSGDILVDKVLFIDGTGLNKVTIQGNNEGRLFDIGSKGDVSIRGVTLRNGRDEEGGAIRNLGRLEVRECRFLENETYGTNTGGGAIMSMDGVLVITDCSFEANSTLNSQFGYGGGLYLFENQSAVVTNTTFEGNSAHVGGAIHVVDSSLTLDQSTITGNQTSVGQGVAIYSAGEFGEANLTLRGSTIVRNEDKRGINAAVYIYNNQDQGGMGSTCQYRNTILENDASLNFDGNGEITSLGFNLLSDTSGGPHLGSDLTNTDPLLQSLAFNGGFSRTHEPRFDSPAIDAGSNIFAPLKDQRAGPRRIDGDNNGSAIADIGAVEAKNQPAIFTQPIGQIVQVGKGIQLGIEAGGNGKLFYQWRKNGQNIPGQNGPELNIPQSLIDDGGIYSVLVMNENGLQHSIEVPINMESDVTAELSDSFVGKPQSEDASGSAFGENCEATFESGEPTHAGVGGRKSVWLTWLAPGDGIVTFQTRGSTFDTVLAAYTGSSVRALTELVSDIDSGPWFSSQIRFNAQKGQIYHIAVDGFRNACGDAWLSWSMDKATTPLPRITEQPRTVVTKLGESAAFTVEAYIPSGLRLDTPTYQWFRVGKPIEGAIEEKLVIEKVGLSHVRSAFHVEVFNKDVSVRSRNVFVQIGSDPDVSTEDKFLNALNNDKGRGLGAAYAAAGFVSVSGGSVGSQIFNNLGSTTESGEPSCGSIGGSSQWLGLEILEEGTLVADTIGSEIETIIAVYEQTGPSLLDLTLLGCDEGSTDSEVSVAVTPGFYFILVDSPVSEEELENPEGLISLNWRLVDETEITWANPTDIDYGTPLSGTQLNAMASVSGSFDYAPGSGSVLDVGEGQLLSATFTPDEPESYSGGVAAVFISVVKADQTITFDPLPDRTFGDADFDLSATATSGLDVSFAVQSGPATLDGNTLSITGTGTVIIRASQPGDDNHEAAPDVDRSFDVAKATPQITWNDPDSIVFGTALSGTQLNAIADVAGTFVYTPSSGTIPDAGNDQQLSVAFTPDDTANYTSVDAQVHIDVTKATPVITWADPADIVYGTALSGTQLNASANVAGTFAYDPSSGTVLNAGENQELGTLFTPDDSANYETAEATAQIDVPKADQTISFAALSDKTFGDTPFDLSATSSSGLDVAFSVQSGPASLDGNTLTIFGAGDVTIRATQSGDSNHNPAPNVDRTFNVAKADQTITFAALTDTTYGDGPLTLMASSTSGLAVSFTLLSGPAELDGDELTINGVGEISVRASQPGDDNHLAAPNVDRSFTVTKTSQTIAFAALPDRTFGDAPFALTATASSVLSVSFSVLSGPATLDGNQLTITGVGEVSVRASQPGDDNHLAAPNVDRSFTVTKASQTITFAALPDRTFGDAPFALTATASSGLGVSFSVLSGPATLDGNQLSITGVGEVTVRASQAGNANFLAAANVDRTFTVAKADQTIAFGTPADRTFGDAPSDLSATSSSSLPVTFEIVSGPASIDGSTLTISGAGNVNVRVSQGGNANYNAAPPIERTFSVGKATQTITFAALSDRTFGDAPIELIATASSGLPVSFSTISGPGTTDGTELTITGAGEMTVRASQAGSANYLAATPVDRMFTVAKKSQIITFAALPDRTFGDAPFGLNATASSGLSVAFQIVSGPATLDGDQITLTGSGNITVRANQAGDANHLAATPVDRSFNVAPGEETVLQFDVAASGISGNMMELNVEATSGHQIQIQKSTDFSTWIEVETKAAEGGTVQFQIEILPGEPMLFYRALDVSE